MAEGGPTPAWAERRSRRLFLIGTGLLALLGGLGPAAMTQPFEPVAYRLGVWLGAATLLVVIVLVVVLLARAFGRVRTPRLRGRLAFWTMLVLGLLSFARAAQLAAGARGDEPPPGPPLSEEERRGLRAGPDSVWHPSLGFAFAVRGAAWAADSAQQSALERAGRARGDAAGWMLADSNGHRRLFLSVARPASLDSAAFRRLFTALFDREPGTSVAESAAWWAGKGEYRRLELGQGDYRSVWCIARDRGTTSALMVCAMWGGRMGAPEGLAFAGTGLHFR